MTNRDVEQIFTLGMITAFSITGFFETIDYDPLFQISLPWWVFVIILVVAVALTIIKMLRLNLPR